MCLCISIYIYIYIYIYMNVFMYKCIAIWPGRPGYHIQVESYHIDYIYIYGTMIPPVLMYSAYI